jgi:hypothetical protein
MEAKKIIVKVLVLQMCEDGVKNLCIFSNNLTKENMQNIISEKIKEVSADYHTKADFEKGAEDIMNGKYWDTGIEYDVCFIKEVEMYI